MWSRRLPYTGATPSTGVALLGWTQALDPWVRHGVVPIDEDAAGDGDGCVEVASGEPRPAPTPGNRALGALGSLRGNTGVRMPGVLLGSMIGDCGPKHSSCARKPHGARPFSACAALVTALAAEDGVPDAVDARACSGKPLTPDGGDGGCARPEAVELGNVDDAGVAVTDDGNDVAGKLGGSAV